MKVNWHSYNFGLGQVYSNGPEFALARVDTDEIVQIGPFATCRDFFQDSLRAQLTGKKCNMYGYAYDPATDPEIPTRYANVMYANSEEPYSREALYNTQAFLDGIGTRLGLANGYFLELGGPEQYKDSGVSLWTGDPAWVLAPPMLSLWTLLIRNGRSFNEETCSDSLKHIDDIIDREVPGGQPNDYIYMKFARYALVHLIEQGYETVFGKDIAANYPEGANEVDFHHYSGIVSYGEAHKTTKEMFPHWTFPVITEVAPSICHA